MLFNVGVRLLQLVQCVLSHKLGKSRADDGRRAGLLSAWAGLVKGKDPSNVNSKCMFPPPSNETA